MKPILAILPMDDRPVNYDYPRYLARLAGYDLRLPPREWLGNPWRDSQHERLVQWLDEQAVEANLLIVAIDTLAYGGLIPSRRSPEPFEQVIARLEILRRIKSRRPDLPILASSVIMRISRHNSNEEEKPYWATYGSAMFRLSFLEHKLALGEASSAEAAESQRMRGEIPTEVYEDYRAGRSRNHAVNQAMLDWVGEGVLDYLLLPQDDTAEFGWNIAEARALQARIRSQGLSDRVISYPGADEIGCLLLAGALCRQIGFKPRIFPRYSSVLAPGVTTSYEDRPIQELLKAHLAPLNGTLADSPEQADFILYLNAPAHQQGDGLFEWPAFVGLDALRQQLPEMAGPFLDQVARDPVFQNTRREMESPQRSPEEFSRAVLRDLREGKRVALADVAFTNGSDLVLGSLLTGHPEITGLVGYGGWNTAGNTLGTVLAQAALQVAALQSGSSPDQEQAHLEFLFLRFIDDYYYQARERTLAYIEDLPALGLPLTGEHVSDPVLAAALDERIRVRVERAAQELERVFCASQRVQRIGVDRIYLPWQRLFEVGFDVHVELS